MRLIRHFFIYLHRGYVFWAPFFTLNKENFKVHPRKEKKNFTQS
jgi:hypothetical protein